MERKLLAPAHLIIALVLALTAGNMSMYARTSAADAFLSAPRAVIPLISPQQRGQIVRERTSECADTLRVNYADGAQLTVALLPARADTLIALIQTLPTPAADTSVRVYTLGWQPLPKAWTEPRLDSWATDKKALPHLRTIAPFMLASGNYIPETQEIILTPTISQWIDSDQTETLATLIKPSLTMKWNPKSRQWKIQEK